MKKVVKRTMLLSLALMAFLLTGCSDTENVNQNTVILNKDGTVIGVIVEEFTDARYNIGELKAMVEEEVGDYNLQTGESKVTLQTFESTEEGNVKVVLKYDSVADYQAFNEETLFAGTVLEAYDAGYEFADMKSTAGDGLVLGKADVLEKGSMKIAIFSECVNVRVGGKIAYVSEGVTEVDKKEATAVEAVENAELFYVIYE